MTDVLADSFYAAVAEVVAIPAAFADVAAAQPAATRQLAAALASGRATHAYLFTGAPGALILDTARAFAAALTCENGGCGTCDSCRRALRGAHLDVVEVAPQGARAYLVEQIRDVVVQTQFAPLAAPRKVFILDRADCMNQAAANAFLKTLEEPPDKVVFILIATSESAVLPTILSRCQQVRFRTIPVAEGTQIVCARTGLAPQRAALALAACEGSVTDAVAFATDSAAWDLRTRVLTALNSLDKADGWGALQAAKSFGEAWTAPAEELKARQKAARERDKEFLDSQSLKAADARDKRAVTAATAVGFARITALVRSWLADVLAAREGAPDRIANTDMADGIARAAAMVNEAGIQRAYDACARAERHIAYNVIPQNALDALMLELRTVLFGTPQGR